MQGDDRQDYATIRQVADALKLDRSAATRRVNAALRGGWLVNQADEEAGEGKKTTRQKRLVIGADLPENAPLMPDPANLCTCASDPGGEGRKEREDDWRGLLPDDAEGDR